MSTSGAAAAIAPEPQDGPGPVATADDVVITFAEFRPAGNASSPTPAPARTPSGCKAASTPSTWPPARPPRSTTALDRAGCCTSRAATAANRSARPALRSTSATPASSSSRAGRRQRRPRVGRRPSVRVRHAHRPVLRAGPRPPQARQDRAALPPPPRRQRPALPARPRHLLPGPPRRERPPARPPAVRRLLRLRSRGAFFSQVGPPAPCVLCGQPAICRSPGKDAPCHKGCAEAWITVRASDPQTRARLIAQHTPQPGAAS